MIHLPVTTARSPPLGDAQHFPTIDELNAERPCPMY
ncbi:hypothetical protein M6B38_370565 [Iris pallida]|uniref:Uncharacterized protein n=1 Tax=Iris pallida TaxID=29817 RepID=A0AAX6GDC1_IRIPA|nr:hypothetical protein M6B38_370565 [Iris pallida]